MSDTLQSIRDLQFTDKPAAEALLLAFLRENTPYDVVQVELTPKAISLNSFNGFMTLPDGTRYFFKTHTETNTVINEYYNAELLAQSGYPIIQPIYKSAEPGKQILIYEVINDKSVFDLAWEIENGDENHFGALTEAQNKADDDLLKIYLATLETTEPQELQQSPVHQLFYHRLTGGRLTNFYGNVINQNALPATMIQLAGIGQKPVLEVAQQAWTINGQHYPGRVIARAVQDAVYYLNPSNGSRFTRVIGHGDAHNGNVFYRTSQQNLLYFDPAFAGKHHPLLDLTKPFFHNVFAMWMYFPEIMRDRTKISLRIEGDTWHVEYDYPLHPVRHMFFRSKVERVLIPILQELKRHSSLPDEWRRFLKAALFCCPFLTMNLTDNSRFPPEISLLGLVMSIEMGAESQRERSLIDKTLDEVEAAIK
jgi:hypothetical protein